MKIAVDVKRVVQEIDLDTGVVSNYLVFRIGEAEHVVPATEEQLQRAIVEANLQQGSNGAGTDVVHMTEEEMTQAHAEGRLSYTPEPVQAPQLGAVGEIPAVEQTTFVQEMLEEPINDQDVADALQVSTAPSQGTHRYEGANPFADVNEPVTAEEMAQYQTEGDSTMPSQVDVVSDETGDAPSFAQIMGAPGARSDAPPTAQQQRKQNIEANRPHAQPKGQQEVVAALRARARRVPPKGLPPHQVDEAGNPKVPQAAPATGFAKFADPSQPEVKISGGPVPPGLGDLDEDGFEQG